jgi:hypothetical protein
MCNVVAEEVKLASISPMPSEASEALPPIPEVQKEK